MSDLKNCPFCKAEPISEDNRKFFLKHKPECFLAHPLHNADFAIISTGSIADHIEAWNTRPTEDAKDKEIERLKADNQVYRDMLNSLLNEEVYHLDNATMTNIKYELDNRGKDTNVPANAPDNNVGKMEEK